MTHAFVDLFFNPNAFYQNLMMGKESLKLPALIVLAGAVVGAAYGYLMGNLTGKMMGALMPGMGTIVAISSVFGAFVGTFLFWIIWTGVFYALSSIFRGKGSFSRSLECIGYGYLPQIIGSLITLIVALNYIPKVKVPGITSAALQDPQVIQEAVNALMHDPAMMELTQIASIISIVFFLWSANIWIFGMRHARQLSARDAALCVGIPVVAYIVYMVYTMAVM